MLSFLRLVYTLGLLFKGFQKTALKLGLYVERASELRKFRIIEDYCQNATWNPEDTNDIDDEIWQIKMMAPDRETGGPMPASRWFDKLERCYNDHRNVIFNRSGRPFQPTYVTPRKYDMVTNDGIHFMCQLGTGEIIGRFFNTYAVGTGNSTELPNDNALESEVGDRVNLAVDGFAQAAGDAMVFQGFFPALFQTTDIYEAAVFNQEVGGIPLFRTVFTEETKIPHVSGQGTFTPAQTVRMVPLPTLGD